MPSPARCWPSASSWPSACWAGTSSRCRPIPRSTAPSRPSPSCLSGSAGWVIVLMGAVLTSSLPSLVTGSLRRSDAPGWGLQLALELLAALDLARHDGCAAASPVAGRAAAGPCSSSLRWEAEALDWVGRLSEATPAMCCWSIRPRRRWHRCGLALPPAAGQTARPSGRPVAGSACG